VVGDDAARIGPCNKNSRGAENKRSALIFGDGGSERNALPSVSGGVVVSLSDQPNIMDMAQAAAYMNIKKSTLYKLVKSGVVPGRKIGGQWRFKRSQLDAMWEDKNDATGESA
jgi:excisionase family DNA binding protein